MDESPPPPPPLPTGRHPNTNHLPPTLLRIATITLTLTFTITAFLVLLPTTYAYVTYEERHDHHPQRPTLHRFPSIPSSFASPPSFLPSDDGYDDEPDPPPPARSYRPNLFLGPIGNLHLCDAVQFYDPDGGVATPNLRATAAASNPAEPDGTPPPKRQRRTADPQPLALLLERGGGCTLRDRVRHAAEVNARHARGEGGPRIRFLLVYDDDDLFRTDRDDATLGRHDGDRGGDRGGGVEEGVWVVYLARRDGMKLRRLIEGHGSRAHPTLNRYPPFLLSGSAFERSSPWEFFVGVDGAYLTSPPRPKRKRRVEAEVEEDGLQPDL